MQQGCSCSCGYRAGLVPVASDCCGQVAAMWRQQERLVQTRWGPGPAQGRLAPRARLRGAAAVPASVPRRRPSGGGWRVPASPRSYPSTIPEKGTGWGQGAWGHPTCGPPCPAHLAAREQAVVEVADTMAEAELGHTVVDQQEVPQLGSRRGSYRAEPVRDPRNPPGAPACPRPA